MEPGRGDRGATWETAPTGVEQELSPQAGFGLLVAGAKVVGWSSLACLGGGISEAPRLFFAGVDACLNSRLALAPR